MELTQSDYEERLARSAAGNATDEDRRLLKLYDREGFTPRETADRVAGDDVDQTDTNASTNAGLEDGPADDYDQLDYRAVQALARERSIDATGKQSEIVERLRAADAARQE